MQGLVRLAVTMRFYACKSGAPQNTMNTEAGTQDDRPAGIRSEGDPGGATRTTGQPQAKQKTAVLLRLSYSLFLKQSVDGDTRTAISHLYVRIDIEDFRNGFMRHDFHRWSRAFDDAILKDEKVCRIADGLIDFM